MFDFITALNKFVILRLTELSLKNKTSYGQNCEYFRITLKFNFKKILNVAYKIQLRITFLTL